MRPVLTAEQMRAAEAPFLDAGVDLMAAAAHSVAECAAQITDGPVLVVVGPGNNGGDGLFAAAELAASRRVWAWCVQKAHPAGERAARNAGVEFIDRATALEVVPDAALVIDAVFGIGARPGLRGDVGLFAAACRDLAVPTLAVDLPSGLDPDSHHTHASFVATHTVTFHALKQCHVAAPAADRCGEVTVVDLGLGDATSQTQLVQPADIAAWWPIPTALSDKYSRGVVGLDTGSSRYPGAALLTLAGALYSGAGMVRYLGPVDPQWIVGQYPSVVAGPGRVQAMVIGSGWADEDRLERYDVPLVVDADAIGVVAELPAGSLLTPHAGELARLLNISRDEVTSDPVGAAHRAAQQTGATVLLKGATQYVATPHGQTYVAVRGPAWTATAGSGDVLAGICGTLLAAGLEAWRAGVMGASIQAMAAPLGPVPPQDAARALPQRIAALTASRTA